MKKIITFVIMIIMLCNLFSIVTFASEDTDSLTQHRAYDFLSTLGIISSDDDASSLTREIFAVYLAKMLKIDDYETDVRYFVDVEKDAFSANAINGLVKLNAISVSEDRLFRPSDPITYNEALKMVIACLGGNELALAKGGWPTGYYAVATSLRITTSVADFNSITVYEAADLIYRAMEVNTRMHYSGEDYSFTSSESSILSSQWNIEYGEGIVTSIYGASIDSSKRVTERNEIYVGDKKFKLSNISEDVFSLFEQEIGFYYYDTDDVAQEILFIFCTDSREKRNIEIDIQDFISLQGKKISFYNNKRDKVENHTLSTVKIIYNGAELGNDVQNTLKNLNKGRLNIIDEDSDGKYDTVFIFDYRNFYVGNYLESVLYNQLNNSDKIDLNEVEYLTIRNEKNEDILMSDIGKNDILSVAQSKDGESVIIRKNPPSFTGKVDSYTNQDGGAITIDGLEYKVEKSYSETLFNYAKLSGTFIFNVDVFGNICYIKASGDDQFNIGYLVACARSDGAFADHLMFKIMDENGEMKVYEIKDSIRVDGELYKANKVDRLESVIANRASGKLIAYTVNEDQKLLRIDTSYKNTGYESERNSFTALFGNLDEKRWYNDLNLAKKIPVKGNTKAYLVPLSGTTNEEKYAVKTVNEILISDVSYYADAYMLDLENGFADAVLVAYDEATDLITNKDTRTVPFVFIEMTMKLNESGDAATYITGCTPNGLESYEVCDNVSFDGLEQGDFIRLWYDVKGRVIKSGSATDDFSLIYDCSKSISEQMTDKNWLKIAGDFLVYKPSGLVTNMSSYRSNFQVSYGTAVSVSTDGVLRISSSEDGNMTESINTNNKKIIVVENGIRDSITARIGTISDIITYEHSGQNCSKILNVTAAGASRCIIVYNL